MISSGSAAKSRKKRKETTFLSSRDLDDSESKFNGLASGLEDEGWLGGHTEFIDSSLPDNA